MIPDGRTGSDLHLAFLSAVPFETDRLPDSSPDAQASIAMLASVGLSYAGVPFLPAGGGAGSYKAASIRKRAIIVTGLGSD